MEEAVEEEASPVKEPPTKKAAGAVKKAARGSRSGFRTVEPASSQDLAIDPGPDEHPTTKKAAGAVKKPAK